MARQSIYCRYCERNKMHERQDVNHVLHLLLSVFCCAFWPFFWFGAVAINTWFDPWLCVDCGNAVPTDKTGFWVACGLLFAFLILGVLFLIGCVFFIEAMNRIYRLTRARRKISSVRLARASTSARVGIAGPGVPTRWSIASTSARLTRSRPPSLNAGSLPRHQRRIVPALVLSNAAASIGVIRSVGIIVSLMSSF
jgi:hypothetical protein